MRSKSSARKSKRREPFWKSLGPDFRHVTDHIGHVIDNSKVSDFIDVAIYGGLAYVGADVYKDIRGALIGPIGLKLAQSGNIVSGAAGLAILGVLGLSVVAPTGEIAKPVQEEGKNYLEVRDFEGKTQKYPIHCEWVGPVGSKDQCRCWYPGLGWHYVDKKFCEATSVEETGGKTYEKEHNWEFFFATGSGFCARHKVTGQTVCYPTQEELLAYILGW